MLRICFLILCLIISVIHSFAELTCGPNQYVDNCPMDCSAHYCPKRDKEPVVGCEKPKKCPPAQCKCQFNYRHAENGTCIPTTSCPPFPCTGANEEYKACPSYCPSDECSQATPDGRCPFAGRMLFVVSCTPQCRCKKGYWRKDGVCVPYAECFTTDEAREENRLLLDISSNYMTRF